jgi:hypothetical protein
MFIDNQDPVGFACTQYIDHYCKKIELGIVIDIVLEKICKEAREKCANNRCEKDPRWTNKEAGQCEICMRCGLLPWDCQDTAEGKICYEECK